MRGTIRTSPRLFVATLTLLLLGALFVAAPRSTSAEIASSTEIRADDPDVKLFVDGLSCPFCQYGVERHLKRIDAVEDIKVNIGDGRVDLILKPDAEISEEEIQKAIDDAGFTLRDIKFADNHQDAGATNR